MSTDFGGIKGPHEITFTRFWGGTDRGLCIQLTGFNLNSEIGYITLTYDEVTREIKKLREIVKET